MNAKTLAAIEASIAKWERNAEAPSPENYLVDACDCPLCDMFWDSDCLGCPVSEKTSRLGCSGTPYTKAFAAWEAWNSDKKSESFKKRAHTAARAEVAFLKSLLPASLPEETR